MPDTITRRAMFAAPLALAPVLAAGAGEAQTLPVVTLLGDSITAGYGLSAAQALPAQLQRELAALGVRALVRGAGVVGSTTAGGLRRVDAEVRADTRLCVVALGGNDLLNFLPPAQVRANLEGIVRRLKARRIDVVLAGLQAPPELGAYARAFNGVFPTVAQAHGVTLHDSLLQGVLLDSRYNQPDLVHPNAAGVGIIARRLAPVVAKALRSTVAARVSLSR
jgi:acyl-CoA thioesterase-1